MANLTYYKKTMKYKSLIMVILIILISLTSGILIANADCVGYIVQSGDTLYGIARANGVTWQELAQLNGLASADYITAGQCLVVNIDKSTSTTAVRGLAMADWKHYDDLSLLRVSWFYGWGEYCESSDNRCVNMVRAMQLPFACYSILLVGNEPNAREPYGAPVAPKDAAAKVQAIEAQCPLTKLVVGNVSADDWGSGIGGEWLKAFLREYKRVTHRAYAQALGVHCYQTQPDWCIGQLATMRRVYMGEMWLTEYNDLTGQQASFERITDYALTHFARVALYTNRQPDAPWALAGASVIMGDGVLDGRGAYYASR